MTISLTFSSIVLMFAVMTILAAIPGVSMLAVTMRSATSGFLHGLATTLGILTGDIAFILLAIYGLSALADILDDRFVIVKILGGACLIWLGISHWLNIPGGNRTGQQSATSSPLSSFLAGLFITLADQKAILFYLGFFPAFINLSAVTVLDTCLIIAITVVAVGGTKLIYAGLASRAGAYLAHSRPAMVMNRLAGVILIAIGLYLLSGAWYQDSNTRGSLHDNGTHQGIRHLGTDHAGGDCQWYGARNPA